MGDPWPERVRQALRSPPRILFHATTPKKIARYRASGAILPPVRGFDTEAAAKEWARLHGRRSIGNSAKLAEALGVTPCWLAYGCECKGKEAHNGMGHA